MTDGADPFAGADLRPVEVGEDGGISLAGGVEPTTRSLAETSAMVDSVQTLDEEDDEEPDVLVDPSALLRRNRVRVSLELGDQQDFVRGRQRTTRGAAGDKTPRGKRRRVGPHALDLGELAELIDWTEEEMVGLKKAMSMAGGDDYALDMQLAMMLVPTRSMAEIKRVAGVVDRRAKRVLAGGAAQLATSTAARKRDAAKMRELRRQTPIAESVMATVAEQRGLAIGAASDYSEGEPALRPEGRMPVDISSQSGDDEGGDAADEVVVSSSEGGSGSGSGGVGPQRRRQKPRRRQKTTRRRKPRGKQQPLVLSSSDSTSSDSTSSSGDISSSSSSDSSVLSTSDDDDGDASGVNESFSSEDLPLVVRAARRARERERGEWKRKRKDAEIEAARQRRRKKKKKREKAKEKAPVPVMADEEWQKHVRTLQLEQRSVQRRRPTKPKDGDSLVERALAPDSLHVFYCEEGDRTMQRCRNHPHAWGMYFRDTNVALCDLCTQAALLWEAEQPPLSRVQVLCRVHERMGRESQTDAWHVDHNYEPRFFGKCCWACGKLDAFMIDKHAAERMCVPCYLSKRGPAMRAEDRTREVVELITNSVPPLAHIAEGTRRLAYMQDVLRKRVEWDAREWCGRVRPIVVVAPSEFRSCTWCRCRFFMGASVYLFASPLGVCPPCALAFGLRSLRRTWGIARPDGVALGEHSYAHVQFTPEMAAEAHELGALTATTQDTHRTIDGKHVGCAICKARCASVGTYARYGLMICGRCSARARTGLQQTNMLVYEALAKLRARESAFPWRTPAIIDGHTRRIRNASARRFEQVAKLRETHLKWRTKEWRKRVGDAVDEVPVARVRVYTDNEAWLESDAQLVREAVARFPAGTDNRIGTISEWLHTHHAFRGHVRTDVLRARVDMVEHGVEEKEEEKEVVEEGAEDDGPEEEEKDAEEGDEEKDAADHGAEEKDAEEKDAVDHGAEEKDAEEKDAVDHGAVDHGAEEKDAVDHGAVDHGAEDHGAEDHGAVDHGAEDHGAEDHGAEDHGAEDHGAEDNADCDKDTEKGAVLEHAEDNEVPPAPVLA